MLQPNIFNTIFVIPILNVLVAFYKLFLTIQLPAAFGFSIIALTIAVRAVLHPFTQKQIETAKKMQELKPHMDRLSGRHKDDKKRLQQEQLKLYQEAGINPASGCLLVIIQIPIFIGLYSTLNLFLQNGNMAKALTSINKALYHPFLKITSVDPNFFGLNLALSPQKSKAVYYLIIPLITAVLQYLQAKYTMAPAPVENKLVTKDAKPDTAGDFQKAMNTQMKYVFPLMIGYFAYTLPVGLSLYWNIFSIFSIIQYKRINSKPQILNSK